MIDWFPINTGSGDHHYLNVNLYKQILWEIDRRVEYCGISDTTSFIYPETGSIANMRAILYGVEFGEPWNYYRNVDGRRNVYVLLSAYLDLIQAMVEHSEDNYPHPSVFVNVDGTKYSGKGSIASGMSVASFRETYNGSRPHDWLAIMLFIREVLDDLVYNYDEMGEAVEKRFTDYRYYPQGLVYPFARGIPIFWPDDVNPSPSESPGIDSIAPTDTAWGPMGTFAMGASDSEGLAGYYMYGAHYLWFAYHYEQEARYRIFTDGEHREEMTLVGGAAVASTSASSSGYISAVGRELTGSIAVDPLDYMGDFEVELLHGEDVIAAITKSEFASNTTLSGSTRKLWVADVIPGIFADTDLFNFGAAGDTVEFLLKTNYTERGGHFGTWVLPGWEHGNPVRVELNAVFYPGLGRVGIYRLNDFDYESGEMVFEYGT